MGASFITQSKKAFRVYAGFSVKSECAVVGTVIGDKPGFSIDSIVQGSNVRETAKNLGVFTDQIVIKITQKLIGIESTQTGNDHFYIRVGKCFMDVFYS